MEDTKDVLNKLNYKINFVRYVEDGEWPHFLWDAVIGGQRFQYKTGVGHRTDFDRSNGAGRNERPKRAVVTIPELRAWIHVPEVLHIISAYLDDEEMSSSSFEDFAESLGLNPDSRKALESYLLCQSEGRRMWKALGASLPEIKALVQTLKDKGEL